MEIHAPLDVRVGTAKTVRLRPSRARLVFASDALSMLAVTAIAGFHGAALVYAAVALLLLHVDVTRSVRLNPTLGQDAGWLIARLGVALLPVLALDGLGWLPGEGIHRLSSVAPVAAVLVLSTRAATYAIARSARVRATAEPTLFIGDDALSAQLTEIFDQYPQFGIRPVGFLGSAVRESSLPLLGKPDDLEHIVRDFKIRRVIVTFGGTQDAELASLFRANERLPIEVHVVPRLFELSCIPPGCSVDFVRGIPLVHLRRPTTRRVSRMVKRTFDVAVASVAIIVTAPVLAVAALAVRLSSPGPILFRQKRIGARNREFEILKFRTMDAHDDSDTTWAVSAEGHITRVGGVLRRLSVDELPQLFNVLRGDMSLVGPRPERPFFVDQFRESIPGYDDRHRVASGMTGWAQIHGRSRGLAGIPERARLDNHYIENWSLWHDITIVLRTIRHVTRGT